MNGIVVVDKPEGITSFGVVKQVKKVFDIRKVGHAGTLDPLATGVLPILLGEATKLSPYLMSEHKIYRTTMMLGVETDTYDREGEIVRTVEVPSLRQEDLAETCACFTGEIEQIPPSYSAIKVKGVPLYRLARQGKMMEAPPRTVTITSIEILDISLPLLTLMVHCGKGTYIRSLCLDIGRHLGCGAHVTALRREAVGAFSAEQAIPLQELTRQSKVLSLNDALPHLPSFIVDDSHASRIRQGRPLNPLLLQNLANEGGLNIKVLGPEGELVAIASDEGKLRRVFAPPCHP